MASHACTHMHLPHAKVVERIKQLQDGRAKRHCSVPGCQAQASDLLVCLECERVTCITLNAHSTAHFETEAHSFGVSPSAATLYCHLCNDYVWDYDEEAETADRMSLDGDLAKEEEQKNAVGSKRDIGEVVPLPMQHYSANQGLCGLTNLGNTCYMNAAVQCLAACEPLAQYLLECRASVPVADNMASAFAQLLQTMYNASSSQSHVAPHALLTALRRANPMFRGLQQQDSQEFLRCILDQCHENLVVARGSDGRSIISDVFSGILRSQITCFKCKKTSVKDDSFYDLSVPIPSKKMRAKLAAAASAEEKVGNGSGASNGTGGAAGTPGASSSWFSGLMNLIGLSSLSRSLQLEHCLAAFCLSEDLSGNDRYECAHCKEKTESRKELRILRLPEVLSVHVKRFRYDTIFSSKLSQAVVFPLEGLDMSPFLCALPEGETRDGSPLYDLFGVVNHRGGIGGGHYVAYTRHAGAGAAGGSTRGQWYEHDDARVVSCKPETVEHSEGYVLFYRRRVLPAVEQERTRVWSMVQDAQAARESGKGGPTDGDCGYLSRQYWTRWSTLSLPGKVNNNDVFCEHGGVLAGLRVEDVARLCVRVPSNVRDYLLAKHGGYAASMITQCRACEDKAKKIMQRREEEDRIVHDLEERTMGGYSDTWFLISAKWLRRWMAFKQATDPDYPDPGPITNELLVSADGKPLPGRQKVTDYRGVTRPVYEYLESVYGGGPRILRAQIELYSLALVEANVLEAKEEEGEGALPMTLDETDNSFDDVLTDTVLYQTSV